MRRTVLLTLFALLLGVALQSSESVGQEKGNISHATLSSFGIAGLQPMSDVEAEQVRGSGFVWVGSFSFALGKVDADTGSSSGAPRLVTSHASRSFGFGGFSTRASSRGFAFAASR